MKLPLIAIVLLLSACEVRTLEYGQFGDVNCSPEQWEKVIKEAKDSIEVAKSGNSNGKSSEWFLEAAVSRNCERKKP